MKPAGLRVGRDGFARLWFAATGPGVGCGAARAHLRPRPGWAAPRPPPGCASGSRLVVGLGSGRRIWRAAVFFFCFCGARLWMGLYGGAFGSVVGCGLWILSGGSRLE